MIIKKISIIISTIFVLNTMLASCFILVYNPFAAAMVYADQGPFDASPESPRGFQLEHQKDGKIGFTWKRDEEFERNIEYRVLRRVADDRWGTINGILVDGNKISIKGPVKKKGRYCLVAVNKDNGKISDRSNSVSVTPAMKVNFCKKLNTLSRKKHWQRSEQEPYDNDGKVKIRKKNARRGFYYIFFITAESFILEDHHRVFNEKQVEIKPEKNKGWIFIASKQGLSKLKEKKEYSAEAFLRYLDKLNEDENRNLELAFECPQN